MLSDPSVSAHLVEDEMSLSLGRVACLLPATLFSLVLVAQQARTSKEADSGVARGQRKQAPGRPLISF